MGHKISLHLADWFMNQSVIVATIIAGKTDTSATLSVIKVRDSLIRVRGLMVSDTEKLLLVGLNNSNNSRELISLWHPASEMSAFFKFENTIVSKQEWQGAQAVSTAQLKPIPCSSCFKKQHFPVSESA